MAPHDPLPQDLQQRAGIGVTNGGGPGTTQWPTLDNAALHGLLGEILNTISPHSEADPVALLGNTLSAIGNAVGRGVHVRVGADVHYLNLMVALVGKTSKARKSMSWGPVRDLLHAADLFWTGDRVMNGLSSGEGLIYAVRDRVEGVNKDGDTVVIDPGVEDKRTLVMEGEFGGVLKMMTRDGNTLSAIVRQAWDGGKLNTLTKNSPLKATGAHISIIGHITQVELSRLLSQTDTENGFANRYIWLLVRRSKELPHGGEWHKVDTVLLVERLRHILKFARDAKEITWGDSAREPWEVVYSSLSEGKPGLFGAATSRAEAQVLRVAAIYAITDLSTTIEWAHLDAALALWDYAEASARYIFGDATGDPAAYAYFGERRHSN